MTADSPYSLEALERRWQEGKTPQLALQLADEHRHRGSLDKAIEALEAGLEVHPEHQASRVALSRDLVDAERYAAAVPHLEQIVRADPAHLVANKLLVKAYTGVGRLEDASEKLDIYEMLGEGDADIEGLRAAIKGEPEPASDADELFEADESNERSAPVEPVEPSEEGPGTAEDAADLLEPLAPAATVTVAEALDTAAPSDTSAESLVTSGLEAEPDGVPEAQEESEQEPEAEAEDPWVAAPAAPVEPEKTSAAEEPFGLDWSSPKTSSYWDAVGEEGIFAVAPEVEAPPVESTPVEESPIPEAPKPELPASPPEEVPNATATLGNLYLDQGLSTEAAETFSEVLERDPENAAAQAGLERARAQSHGVNEAVDLESSAAEAGDAGGLSSAERKKVALTQYLARIRRGAEAGY